VLVLVLFVPQIPNPCASAFSAAIYIA